MTDEPEDDEVVGAIEPDATDAGVNEPQLKPTGGRRSFARMRRELTDDELTNPAVQKMMMDEIERLDRELQDLATYRERHADADKACAILHEKLKPKLAGDVFFGGCTVVGAIMVGLSPSAWTTGVVGIALVGLGVALVVTGIAAKVILK